MKAIVSTKYGPPGTAIVTKPSNLNYDEAAAVCDGLILAYTYLRQVPLQRGMRVLINGASGSIGSAVVQLAKYFGAEVTAVCKTDCSDFHTRRCGR